MRPIGGLPSFLRRPSGAALGLVAMLAGAAGSAGLPNLSASTHAGLVTEGGSAWLEVRPGTLRPLSLPAGVSINLAERLSAGWVVAGTQPAPLTRELVLLSAESGTTRELPVPARGFAETALLRVEPVPLLAGGRLSGLAWLEGTSRQSLAVRVASWDGTRWSAPQTISPPGPGSQLSLSAARLGDGTWLLAWSAFDGRADTVVWSRGAADRWSLPEPVAASAGVPNITPDLVATPEGAAIAWSRLEGTGYRVVVARFNGSSWLAPVTVGALGSVYPQFVSQESTRTRLLYRSAAPAGWSLAELDAMGRQLREAHAPAAAHPGASDERSRPGVAEQPNGIRFLWPGSGQTVDAPWTSRP